MSTFKGFLSDPKLRFVAIDYFESSTYDCTTFMVSHVHWDHLAGLFNPKFISLVNESADKFLYCSTFTAHLLTKFRKFAIDEKKIIAMDVNKSYIIRRDNVETDIVVTCLAAGHCPGSVMFLLEYMDKRILYTGDFRIRVPELKKVKCRLTNDDGSIIAIDELYLDTTFAFRSLLDDFPQRESSEELIIDQVERWMREVGPSLKINISLPYRFGLEYLYISLSKKFKKPISIHDYNSYAQVEDIVSHVVSFEEARDDQWFIHACMRKRACPLSVLKNVRNIRPCALSFLNKLNKDSLVVDKRFNVPFELRNGIWKVFYSSHCSLKELQDVVEFLQPDRIFPNVRSDTMSEKEMLDLIRKIDSGSDHNAAGDNEVVQTVLNSKENVGRSFSAAKRVSEERYMQTLKKFKLKV